METTRQNVRRGSVVLLGCEHGATVACQKSGIPDLIPQPDWDEYHFLFGIIPFLLIVRR